MKRNKPIVSIVRTDTCLVDGIGNTTFSWTDGDQLASENGPWVNDAVNYTYNDRLRTSLTLLQPHASPWVQGYGYDSMMRLGTITSPSGGTLTIPSGTFTYSYTGGGDRVQQVQFPAFPSSSTLYIQNQYDSLARLTNTYVNSPISGTMDLHAYAYDLGSEVTQQVFTAGNFINYSYDSIGQLKVASGKGPGGLISRLQEQFGYGYDKAWNLNFRTNNGLVQTFSVNDLNELANLTNNGVKPLISGSTTSPATNVTVNGQAGSVYSDATFAVTNVALTSGWNTLTATARDTNNRVSSSSIQVNYTGSANYLYDTNGNLTSDGTRGFAYDVENELVSVWQTNVWREDFAYDGLQRRRITTEYAWGGSSWQPTNQVLYVYDVNLVVQERDGNNLPLTTYTRGNDLSGTLQGAGGIGGLLARSDREQVVPALISMNNPHPQYVISSFYHSDGNGNVTMLVQPNGFSVASYEYDPYGNLLSMSGMIAGANKYRFSSKEWNENSGLYCYGYRFYDPNLQRWLNRDPIQEWGGINLYAFVANNPIDLLDFLGLCPPENSNGNSSGSSAESKEDKVEGAKEALKDAAKTAAEEGSKKVSEDIANEPLAKSNPRAGTGPLPGSAKLGAVSATAGAATEVAMGFAQAGPGMTAVVYMQKKQNAIIDADDDDALDKALKKREQAAENMQPSCNNLLTK